MDSKTYGTPQKVPHFRSLFTKNRNSPAPSGSLNQRKAFHPRTPSSSFSVFPAVNSPPAKRFSKVKNPFEALLLERLHLPIIGSPTLFQRPPSPQLSSTQFEWTIDEVSSLQPANLIPDETQFQDSPDPDLEAKAQSAISSYFKEQQIVPSPVDCPLRNQRIILSQINGNTPITKSISKRKVRNNFAQTILSLPPAFPKELEDALAPYLNFNEHQQQPLDSDNNSSNSSSTSVADRKLSNLSTKIDDNDKDISLRRKLFDFHNIILIDDELQSTAIANNVENFDRSCSSPERQRKQSTADKEKEDSFGSISPISLSVCLSPVSSPGQLFTSSQSFQQDFKMNTFIENSELEQLSPIHPPLDRSNQRQLSRKSSFRKNLKGIMKSQSSNEDKENYRYDKNTTSEHTISEFLSNDLNLFSTDPRCSLSPPPLDGSPAAAAAAVGMSTDSSFNFKISRLAVNSSMNASIIQKTPDANNRDELAELADDDPMQTSINSNDSPGSNAPLHGKRHSSSRKNLSQSFLFSYYKDNIDNDNDGDDDADGRHHDNLAMDGNESMIDLKKELLTSTITSCFVQTIDTDKKTPKDRSALYRKDSGFNEWTSSSSQFSSINVDHDPKVVIHEASQEQEDASMLCCSTPSKLTDF